MGWRNACSAWPAWTGKRLTSTPSIPAIEVTGNATSDGGYDTEGWREAIAQRGAQAVIPTRENAKPWKDQRPGAKARNAILATMRRLGRKSGGNGPGYHRRSLVEIKMRCFKPFGERVMARGFGPQAAALQVRAAVLNRFTRWGTPTTVAVTMA